MRSLRHAFLIGVEGVTEIWLVRHADVYEELEDVADPPLSRLGHQQAERLAQRLRALEIRAVYSSPHRRALQTAHAFTDRVTIDPRLAEARADFAGGKVDVLESPAAVVQRMQDAVDGAAAGVVRIKGDRRMAGPLCDIAHLEALP